jgi:hypothetical protein
MIFNFDPIEYQLHEQNDHADGCKIGESKDVTRRRGSWGGNRLNTLSIIPW